MLESQCHGHGAVFKEWLVLLIEKIMHSALERYREIEGSGREDGENADAETHI